MPVRSIKVWNASASAWEGVGVEAPDFGAFVGASLFNAKGDLLTATANDTPAILTAGSNGQTLVADSSQTTGLRYVDGMIGRNAVINSDFSVWQRGTSGAGATGATTGFVADRWQGVRDGFGAGLTMSRQNTSDTTNLPSIQYCVRVQRDSGNTGTGVIYLQQNLESVDSRKFAGRVVTLSFWARRGANYSGSSNNLEAYVASGTGTDQNVVATGFTGRANPVATNTVALTTTWQRFSYSGTVATSATQLAVLFQYTPSGTAGANDWFEVAGVQLEASPVATPFEFEPYEATLRKCQRYYQVLTESAIGTPLGIGANYSASYMIFTIHLPTSMRTAPSLVSNTGTDYFSFDRNGASDLCNSVTLNSSTVNNVSLFNNTEISGTAGHAGIVKTNNAAASIAASAEL